MVPRGHTGQAKPETAPRTSPRDNAAPGTTPRRSPLEATITVRTALIGGGATGIGYAIAARLARRAPRRDHRPARRAARGGRGAARRRPPARRSGTLVSDIAAPDAAAAALDAMTARYGPPDVVVLNAGGPPPGRILDVADDAWRAGAELLLLGPLRLARLVLPAMAGRGFGRLVFVTSTAVRQPQPDLAISVVLRAGGHRRGEAAVAGVRRGGVTVNCVAPGATDTQRRRDVLASRAARTGQPLAELDGAGHAGRCRPAGPAPRTRSPRPSRSWRPPRPSYINGTVLTVDGGRTETF